MNKPKSRLDKLNEEMAALVKALESFKIWESIDATPAAHLVLQILNDDLESYSKRLDGLDPRDDKLGIPYAATISVKNYIKNSILLLTRYRESIDSASEQINVLAKLIQEEASLEDERKRQQF